MRGILVSFFFLTSLFTMAGPGYAGQGLPHGDFKDLYQTVTVTVNQVIDPMTIQSSDGRLITLAGLDFPDYTVHRNGNLAETAVKILKDMLVGQKVNLYQTTNQNWGRTNRMGRQIAQVERKSDGAWVQGALIELGLARVMTTQRNPEMASQMYALEQKARSEQSGLWAADAFPVLAPAELADKIASFQIVEGIIKSVSLNKNRIYLNFDKNWHSDFTISIPPEAKHLFQAQGIDPMQLGGRAVRARGWVRSYNGPFMEIDHPEALEFIDPATVQQPLQDKTETLKLGTSSKD